MKRLVPAEEDLTNDLSSTAWQPIISVVQDPFGYPLREGARLSAIRTRSGRELAPIFFITL
jgi:hypothetical protein